MTSHTFLNFPEIIEIQILLPLTTISTIVPLFGERDHEMSTVLCLHVHCVLKMLTLSKISLTVLTYFDGFSWHMGKRILGLRHTCGPRQKWDQRSYRGHYSHLPKICIIGPCIHILFHVVWTKEYWGMCIMCTQCDPNSKVILGYLSWYLVILSLVLRKVVRYL